jgi:hypothetical protein
MELAVQRLNGKKARKSGRRKEKEKPSKTPATRGKDWES